MREKKGDNGILQPSRIRNFPLDFFPRSIILINKNIPGNIREIISLKKKWKWKKRWKGRNRGFLANHWKIKNLFSIRTDIERMWKESHERTRNRKFFHTQNEKCSFYCTFGGWKTIKNCTQVCTKIEKYLVVNGVTIWLGIPMRLFVFSHLGWKNE